MDLGLRDRVVLVVGGSGYLGREIARQFAAEGARVVLGGRDADRMQAVANGLDGEVSAAVLDTRDEVSVRAAVDAVAAEHGHLDVLVVTAAPPADQLDPARDRDPAQILDAIDGKALGALRAVDAALPHLRAAGHGRVVLLGGQNSFMTASLTATARNVVLDTAAKTTADALIGSGVTVNVVSPGTVRNDPSAEVAMGRPGESTPEQVAALVVFLASRQAGGVSGERIAVGHRMRGVQ